MKVYDLEHHYILTEWLEWLAPRSEKPFYDPVKKVFLPTDEGSFAEPVTTDRAHGDELCDFNEKRIEAMDKAGIDCACMSPTMGLETLPKEESIYFSRLANDKVATFAKKYPGRIIGTAALPTLYVDEAIKELERCVKELGFKYWHTHSNYGAERLCDEKFQPLLAKAEELNCPIYLHPNLTTDTDLRKNGFLISSSGLGFGMDTMKTATIMLINGTFDRFPNLRVILGHLGEYFPFILDRMDNRFAYLPDTHVVMKHEISYYFKNKNIMVTTSGNMSKEAFECTKKVLGIDSIMYASDYSYENFNESVKFINELDLTDEERDKIWGLNAEKYILNIK